LEEKYSRRGETSDMRLETGRCIENAYRQMPEKTESEG
jgi:hypothetical protein